MQLKSTEGSGPPIALARCRTRESSYLEFTYCRTAELQQLYIPDGGGLHGGGFEVGHVFVRIDITLQQLPAQRGHPACIQRMATSPGPASPAAIMPRRLSSLWQIEMSGCGTGGLSCSNLPNLRNRVIVITCLGAMAAYVKVHSWAACTFKPGWLCFRIYLYAVAYLCSKKLERSEQ